MFSDTYAGPVLLESPVDAPRDLFLLLHAEPASSPELSKADAPGERWITLSPHGKNGAKGEGAVHVKIKTAGDGSAHVVSGPGELRGLRLTRLASPEELKERRQQRDHDRAEAKKSEKEAAAKKEQADLEASASDPEHAQRVAQSKIAEQQAGQEKQRQLTDLEEQMHQKRSELLQHAAGLTGDEAYQSDRAEASIDPAAKEAYKEGMRGRAEEAAEKAFAAGHQDAAILQMTDDPERAARGAGSVIAARNVRQISSGLASLRQNIIGELIRDPQLKAAVMGDDPDVSAQAADLESGRVNGAPGYARATERQAAEQGYTKGDARAESADVFADRINKIARENPKRAGAIVKMREGTMARALAERAVKRGQPDAESLNAPAPVKSLPAPEIQKKAEQVRQFLKTHNELQALEKQARRLRLNDDPQATPEEKAALAEDDKAMPPGAELDADVKNVDAQFASRLDAEVKDAAKSDVTRAFLDSVDSDAEHGGHAADIIRKAMTEHIGVGAHAHLANVALAALGHEGLDRQVVDALGVEASAQLLAHAIRRDSPEGLSTIKAGLAQHHDDTSLSRMQEAMSLADAARADAAEIDLPPITGSTDAALVMQLNKERKARIGEAHEALGTALGQVEAGAALNLALKGSGQGGVHVRFGNAPTAQVALQLRALGLQDGDYSLERSPEKDATLVAHLTPAGCDRLTRPLDARHQADARAVTAIKEGHEDEPSYLPAGFEERSSASFDEHPAVPPVFEQPPNWQGGLEAGVHALIGSRVADGWEPSEIYAHLRDSVGPTLSPAQSDEFFRHVANLMPITRQEERTDRTGEKYMATVSQDIDHMPEVRSALDRLGTAHLDAHHPGETAFHARTLPDDEHTREAVFRTLAATPGLAAAFAPPGDIGGSAAGRERAKAIKKYFEKNILAEAPEQRGGLEPEVQAALTKIDARYGAHEGQGGPDKWGGDAGGFDLFGAPQGGSEGPTTLKLHAPVAESEKRLGDRYDPQQRQADLGEQRAMQQKALSEYGLQSGRDYTLSEDGRSAQLTDAGKHNLSLPAKSPKADGAGGADVVQGGLEGLNPKWVQYQRERGAALAESGADAPPAPTVRSWEDFVQACGGHRRAYRAVQERMQSEFVHEFHGHYGAVTGQQLPLSKQRTEQGDKLVAATNPARLAQLRRDRARTVARVRQRTGGKFVQEGEGGAAGRADQAQRDAQAAALQQGSMFGAFGGDDPSALHGGEVTAAAPRHLDVAEDERYSLGHGSENRLAQLVNSTPLGVKPGDSPVGLIKNLDWGTGQGGRHIGKQRGVKILLKTGRLLGFYGAGSGKTAMQIGGFTQAHSEGKARKALLVCPSIVRNQFGEEAAKMTTPGQYTWHAHDDSYEGRKAAYSGDTHMVVVTHATFRDDTLRLMAEHQGVTPQEMVSRFERMDRGGRAAAYKAAVDHHGIPTDYLAIDEAHDFLNRSGKADSLMSHVAEAAMDNHRHKSLWTGSPVKNDPSEIHDWLSKVDPERFSDRASFLRRYGVNTLASREALQRLMDSYSYVDSTRPNITRKVVWGQENEGGHSAIPLTPEQQQAYQGVHDAFTRASRAQRAGGVDVEAARTLSPRSFEGAADDQHETIARGLQNALGTLKYAALGRVVNEFPPEHNAKVQHVLKLASERTGKGGVIFARNRASVSMLKEQLEAAGKRVGVIDGSSTTDEKGKVRQSFDRGEVDIVIASDAGATGANLQKRGEWLVNYDLPLTQKTLEQRNARIDRLGQGRAIELHHLQTETAYDTDNVHRLEHKRELGEILQGEFHSLEDSGLAGYLKRARAELQGDAPEGWAEPLSAPIHEDAKPQERGPDVPEGADGESYYSDNPEAQRVQA